MCTGIQFISRERIKMNLFSLIVAGLLTTLTLAFTVMLVSAIVFNMKAGKKYRRSLARRFDRLRLSKMLSALGIDVNSYLHTQGIVDIQQHMDLCSACENTSTCDEQLAAGDIKASDIEFCNNEKSLQDIARNNA
jgi:hypothetical protein